jgi:hypothetical protein
MVNGRLYTLSVCVVQWEEGMSVLYPVAYILNSQWLLWKTDDWPNER